MTTSPVADIIATLTQDPGRPRLTWYGPDSERIELSGAVLANWVTKTTNLLVEEFDAGPGAVVALDLPAHWRTLVWALAIWRTGATVTLVSPKDDDVVADLAITHRPEAWTHLDVPLVVVALPALARSFDGALPAGAIDAAGAVMTYGDQLGFVPPTDRDSLAIRNGVFRGSVSVPFQDLLPWAESSGLATAGDRVLLTSDAECTSCAHPTGHAAVASDLLGDTLDLGLTDGASPEGHAVPAPTNAHLNHLGRRGKLLQVLRAALNAWVTGGSVVLLDPTNTDRITDPAERAHLIATERIGA